MVLSRWLYSRPRRKLKIGATPSAPRELIFGEGYPWLATTTRAVHRIFALKLPPDIVHRDTDDGPGKAVVRRKTRTQQRHHAEGVPDEIVAPIFPISRHSVPFGIQS